MQWDMMGSQSYWVVRMHCITEKKIYITNKSYGNNPTDIIGHRPKWTTHTQQTCVHVDRY